MGQVIKKQVDTDYRKVHDFYQWARDYWIELSTNQEGPGAHALNFGYWQEGTVNLCEAQENFRRTIMNLLGPMSQSTLGLEIGCGIGGFSVNIVKETGIHMTCVDLLKEHVERTRHLACQEKVSSLIDVRQGWATSIPTEKGMFDFAVCQESSFHYPDKQRFFQEAYRVLKEGGRLIVADITCEKGSQVIFNNDVYFPSSSDLAVHACSCGFEIVSRISIGEQVFEPLQRYVKRFNADRRGRINRYWELVLSNYSRLSADKLMDYQIFVLQKSERMM